MALINSCMPAEWGTLGELKTSASGHLVHVLETSVATLRHAYFETGGATVHHCHDRASLFYGVGGPCLTLEPGRPPAMVARRLTFHPAGYEHSLRFLGKTHVLAIEFPEIGVDGHEYRWPPSSAPLPATLYNLLWNAMFRIADHEPRHCRVHVERDGIVPRPLLLRRGRNQRARASGSCR